MGNMIWSDWGRLVGLVAGVWTFWGGLWAVYYRKYFWDFIGGKLGPVGTIPSAAAAPFVAIIINIPAVQGMCMLLGLFTLACEWPVFPGTFLYRSLTFKIVLYFFTASLSALLYQTADASVIYLVVILAYVTALRKGEIVGEKAWSSSNV